jgi:hypothetical protein
MVDGLQRRGGLASVTVMDDELREHLLRLERSLARRDPAGVDGGLPSLIADDFLEFGASGRTWDAGTVGELLASRRPNGDASIEEFEIDRLAADVVLATYRIGRPRPSNRCSIWVRRRDRWQIRFHQGTPGRADR